MLQSAADMPASAQVTLGFNMARIREASGHITAAAAEYKVFTLAIHRVQHYLSPILRSLSRHQFPPSYSHASRCVLSCLSTGVPLELLILLPYIHAYCSLNCTFFDTGAECIPMHVAGLQAMLKQFPDYMHCYLRLACIADGKGRRKEALYWLQSALERQPEFPDALALKGTPLMLQYHAMTYNSQT